MNLPISARELLRILHLRWRPMLAVFLAVNLAVVALILLVPPRYKAVSTLLVKFGHENLYTPDTPGGQPVPTADRDTIVTSQLDIVQSDAVLRAAFRRIGSTRLYRQFETEWVHRLAGAMRAALGLDRGDPEELYLLRFKDRVRAEAMPNTNVVEVAFLHRDPVIAAAAANAIVEIYQRVRLDLYRRADPATGAAEVADRRRRLEAAEAALAALRAETGAFAPDEQRRVLAQRLGELEQSLAAATAAADDHRQRLTVLERGLAGLGANSVVSQETRNFAFLDDARARLLQLQIEESSLANRFTADYPKLRDTRAAMEQVRRLIESAGQGGGRLVLGTNAERQQLDLAVITAHGELEGLRARAATLQQQILAARQELGRLSAAESRLGVLQADRDQARRDLQSAAARAEDQRVAEAMFLQRLSSVAVVDAAHPPALPVFPRPLLMLALAGLMGALAAVGTALLAERGAARIRDPADIAAMLGLPTLLALDDLGRRSRRRMPAG